MKAARAWLHGFSGRMGTSIRELAKTEGRLHIVGGSDARAVYGADGQPCNQSLAMALEDVSPDLVIDFSLPAGNTDLRSSVTKLRQLPAVLIGTTGLSDEQVAEWHSLVVQRRSKLLVAPNTSLGVIMLARVAKEMARVFAPRDFDIEISETHHRAKADAPSGTALYLAKEMIDSQPNLTLQANRKGKRQSGEIGVHALRGGNVFGEHTIRFMGMEEELTISHRALNRTLFARGAIELANWLSAKEPGIYNIDQVEF